MAASSASSGRLSALPESVALPKRPPVEGIIFLKVVTCELCGHSSNEPTPLTVDVPGFTSKCWPFQGTE
eukprot:6492788-Amphidinium_carterae.5